ncbi:MAG: DUF6516 family protein [Chromatiaceae bacterium]|nr:DUF6516 family protein [Chromatiaceae bacterium]MCF7996243.1 DUF6516 family protein [Chromatiaceae bacterium]MCF8004814.1 DUF6516 family protein [Chromatiaceae bacterium]MCF8017694.1 DUF6516 family protein [Chromatiaceae bacterium]
MNALQILRDRKQFANGVIVERVVWALPGATADHPHGLKYRLYCGHSGRCLVRYDNERGKGDHKHIGDTEQPYPFVSLTQLLADFAADVAQALEAIDEGDH